MKERIQRIKKVYPKANCPVCRGEFDLTRKDKKYCSKKCQTNASRGPRTVKDSPAQQRIHATFNASCSSLSLNFYETPPAFRTEFMERLLQEGRRLAAVRRILTKKVTFWSYRDRGVLPIQQVFHHYCHEVYGMTVRELLDKSSSLPSDISYPCEYYGPDKEPVYSDGTYFKRSEQQFISRRGKVGNKVSTGKPYNPFFVAAKLSTRSEIDRASPRMKELLRYWIDQQGVGALEEGQIE